MRDWRKFPPPWCSNTALAPAEQKDMECVDHDTPGVWVSFYEPIIVKTTSYLMAKLVKLKGSFPPFLSGPPGQLTMPIRVWTQQTFSCLDMVGVGTHPVETLRRARHDCWDDKKWAERRGPVKDRELTKPMVDIISQVTADCLDPSGNIDKESRLVQSIR